MFIDDFVISVKIGIIGGSGLDDPDILEGRTERYVDTPYGKVSCVLWSNAFSIMESSVTNTLYLHMFVNYLFQ